LKAQKPVESAISGTAEGSSAAITVRLTRIVVSMIISCKLTRRHAHRQRAPLQGDFAAEKFGYI
jgi:hypothetical protein